MATTSPITINIPNSSGVDFNAIIQAILAQASVPISALNHEISTDQTAISELGIIGGSLSQLQDALSSFENSATSPALSAKVQDGAPFSASVTGTPVQGNYLVTVNQLAQAQITASQGYSSTSDTVGTGTITITIAGVAHPITIDAGNDTLQGVADAINQAALGVSAQVVNTGLPGAAYRLELLASQTGLANAFQVSASLSGGVAPDFSSTSVGPVDYSGIAGSANGASNGPLLGGTYTGTASQGFHFNVVQGGTVGTDPITIQWSNDAGESGVINVSGSYTSGTPIAVGDGLTLSFAALGGTLNTGDSFDGAVYVPTIQSARNAVVQAGNQIVSSSTNEVQGAIPGVTLELTGTGGPYSMQVTEATATESTALNNFVKAFNSVIAEIQVYTEGTPGQALPALNANGPLRVLATALNSALSGINLAKLGITIDNNEAVGNTGQLTFSSSDFTSALQADPNGTHAAMQQLYTALHSLVDGALDPTTGVVASQTDSYQARITQLNSQVSRLQDQLDRMQSQLQVEFANLQSLVQKYNTLGQLLNVQSDNNNGSGNSNG
jgi:flagellar hook-associated protein 2